MVFFPRTIQLSWDAPINGNQGGWTTHVQLTVSSKDVNGRRDVKLRQGKCRQESTQGRAYARKSLQQKLGKNTELGWLVVSTPLKNISQLG